MTVTRTGRCMCGVVRFEAKDEPFDVTHCHCHSCRKHNGAAVVTLAGYRAEQVTFSGADRRQYQSSPGVLRGFCGDCGTPLTWEGDGGDLGPIIEFHISTFDEPESLVPTAHAFEPERIAWMEVADDLPRYEGFPGEGTPLRHGPATG
ncbi:MAG: GFA family protein [bacterium]|nr:GFA family protein [bacterium]